MAMKMNFQTSSKESLLTAIKVRRVKDMVLVLMPNWNLQVPAMWVYLDTLIGKEQWLFHYEKPV